MTANRLFKISIDVLLCVLVVPAVLAQGQMTQKERDRLVELKKAVTNGIYLLNMYSRTENKVFEIVIER